MYQAKHGGGNQVISARAPGPTSVAQPGPERRATAT